MSDPACNSPAPRTRVIRVAHFGPGGQRGPGGMARFLLYLIPTIRQRHPEVECRVIDTYGAGSPLSRPLWFAAALAQLVWLGVWGKADLAHIHMAAFGSVLRKLLLAATARRLGLRVVIHLHAADMAEFVERLSPYWRARLVRALTRADRLVVLGQYWYDYMTGPVGIPPERVTIIPNGVPDPGWSRPPGTGQPPAIPPTDPSPGDNPAPCRLLALGELGPRKGTPDILSALASPPLRDRAWVATLAGNGLVAQYQAEVLRLGLEGRISIPGWIDREAAWGLLSAADILLLPSHLEGLPIAILEAMAAGVAVIATPVGDIPSAITDGETGLLTPPGDPPALAAVMVRLIDDPALRARLARAARDRFERRFSIERTADCVVALYRSITQRIDHD